MGFLEFFIDIRLKILRFVHRVIYIICYSRQVDHRLYCIHFLVWSIMERKNSFSLYLFNVGSWRYLDRTTNRKNVLLHMWRSKNVWYEHWTVNSLFFSCKVGSNMSLEIHTCYLRSNFLYYAFERKYTSSIQFTRISTLSNSPIEFCEETHFIMIISISLQSWVFNLDNNQTHENWVRHLKKKHIDVIRVLSMFLRTFE